jgi:2,4-dienoyl-CoA reductase-like NADH-dependent reductase (Old Yellow Enzyme family)
LEIIEVSILFEQTAIGKLLLANRFVRSATYEGLAGENGTPTSGLIEKLVGLAEGGVGLIITSHAYVRPEGQAGLHQLGIYKDELIPGFREVTGAVHRSGGKIVLQISHAGIFSTHRATGRTPFVVSRMPGKDFHEITGEDIGALAGAFAAAAMRAKAAGFDGVQIHAAHGYLISQFLSPVFNQRVDVFGGTIENRTQPLLQIYKAIRKAVGDAFPVLIKLNCNDFADGGLTTAESLLVARRLAGMGLDAIELSGGLLTNSTLTPSRAKIRREEDEAYFREEAHDFKDKIGIPLILVGGIRSFSVAESLIEEGIADYISLSRPLIKEPGLINRWKSGNREKAKCISCNNCFRTMNSPHGVYCDIKS